MNIQDDITGMRIRVDESSAGDGNDAGNETSHASEIVYEPEQTRDSYIQSLSAMDLEQLLFSSARKERYMLVRQVLGLSLSKWTLLVQIIDSGLRLTRIKDWDQWGWVELRGLHANPDKPHDIVVVCLKAIACMMMCGGSMNCFSTHEGGPRNDSHRRARGTVGYESVSPNQSSSDPTFRHISIENAPRGPRVQNIPTGPRLQNIPSGPRAMSLPTGPRAATGANISRLTNPHPATVGNNGGRVMSHTIHKRSRQGKLLTVLSGNRTQGIANNGTKAELTAKGKDGVQLSRLITELISHHSSNRNVNTKGEIKTEPTTIGQNRDIGDSAQDSIPTTPPANGLPGNGLPINRFGALMGQQMTPEEYMLRQGAYDHTNGEWVVDVNMDVNSHIDRKRNADSILESPDLSTDKQLEDPTIAPPAATDLPLLQSLATPIDFHRSISFYINTPFIQLPYGSMFINGGGPPMYQLVQLHGHVSLAYFVAELRYKHSITPELIVCAIEIILGNKMFFLDHLDWAKSEVEWTMVLGAMLLGEKPVAYVSVSVGMNGMGGMAEV